MVGYPAVRNSMESYSSQEISRLLFGNDTDDVLFEMTLNQSRGGNGRMAYERALGNFRDTLFAYRQPQNIALLCLYAPVFVVALGGNLLVLLVVLVNRFMRNVTNCFIVNLAIADLLVTMVNVPLEISLIVYREWLYGEGLCKFTSYLQAVCVAASVFTIMTLSVDRYWAIKRPSTFRKYSTGNNAWKVALIVWTISALVMTPLLNVRRLQVFDLFVNHPFYFCVEDWHSPAHRTAYDIFLFIFMVITPGVFVSLCYSVLFYHLWKQDRNSLASNATAVPLSSLTSTKQAVNRQTSASAPKKPGGEGGVMDIKAARLSPCNNDCRKTYTPSLGSRDDGGSRKSGKASSSSSREQREEATLVANNVTESIGRRSDTRATGFDRRTASHQSLGTLGERRPLSVEHGICGGVVTVTAVNGISALGVTTTLKQVSQVIINRRRVAKMLLFLAILFALCWTPYHIVNIYIDFMPTNLNSQNTFIITLLHLTILLGHLNSALNPILYCYLNNSFRQCAARLLHLNRKKHRNRRMPPDSPPALPPNARRRLFYLQKSRLKNRAHQYDDILR